MWSKIVFSIWLLIIQNAWAYVEEPETLDVFKLMRKCADGDLEGVKQLVAKFGSKEVVETQRPYGHTCLYIASIFHFTDLVSFLLENDADPNQKTKDGVTPLSGATQACQLSNVKQLLAHGADAKEDYSQALYAVSCWNDDETQGEIARLLLQHCANPDDDKPGREPGTPFMEAVDKAHIGSIRVMAEWMERVEQINQDDIDPWYGDIDDVRKAIAEGQEKRKMLLVYPFPAEAGEKLSLGPETLCAKAKICLQDRGGERRAA